MSHHHAPSSASSLSGGPTMIGMIRARKLATKIKKRAQFLVAERKRKDNTGKAVIVHRDFPKNDHGDDHLRIGKSSFQNLRIQTPTQSRSPSITSKQNYSTAIHTIQEPKNTYRTEPVNRFSRKEVTDVMEEVLSEHLDGQIYDHEFCKDTSKKMSDIIKQRVKYMGYSRYKLICLVYMGQVKNQGMRIASRCLWNTQFDNVAEASYRNGELFAVATVFGAFYE